MPYRIKNVIKQNNFFFNLAHTKKLFQIWRQKPFAWLTLKNVINKYLTQ